MILVLNRMQLMALGDIHGFMGSTIGQNLGGPDLYVLLEGTGNDPKQVEAILKHAPVKPKTENHMVISLALAKELRVEGTDKDIRILDVYQKAADVDLNKL